MTERVYQSDKYRIVVRGGSSPAAGRTAEVVLTDPVTWGDPKIISLPLDDPSLFPVLEQIFAEQFGAKKAKSSKPKVKDDREKDAKNRQA